MGLGADVGEELAQVEAEGGQVQVGPGQLQLFKLEQGLSTATKIGIFIVSIGVSALAVAFVEWLANLAQRATSWLSFFGVNVATGIAHGAQWLTNRLGTQYNKVDAEIGSGFTELNTELKLLGADVLAAGFATWQISKRVAALARVPSLKPIVQQTTRTVKLTKSQLAALTPRVVKVEKLVKVPLPTWVPRRIKTLETQVQRQQIEIAQLKNHAQSKPHPSTLAQAVPIVALGLAGLGLNASRCEGTRAFNKALCEAGPQGLNKLLDLLALSGLFVGLVELAEIEQGVTKDLAGLVHDFWGV